MAHPAISERTPRAFHTHPHAVSSLAGEGDRRMPYCPTRGRSTGAAVILTGSLMLWASPAMAAGFWLYEMGTPDLGTASAGRAALAKDAATVFGNPAGMTSLDRSQLLIGTQLVVGDVHFDRGPDTTVAGGNGGNASGTVPGGSFYYAQSVTPDLKLGFWSGLLFRRLAAVRGRLVGALLWHQSRAHHAWCRHQRCVPHQRLALDRRGALPAPWQTRAEGGGQQRPRRRRGRPPQVR
jgi:Outer membrane protein transport protein (OMPP1/FadL/TodX)